MLLLDAVEEVFVQQLGQTASLQIEGIKTDVRESLATLLFGISHNNLPLII